MPKYTPIMNEPVRTAPGLQHRYDAYKPRKQKGMTETPQMRGPERYEKGRKNKSRS